MAKGSPLPLLFLFWLGLITTSMLSHYVVDAAGALCQENVASICVSAEGNTDSSPLGVNFQNAAALHAGFMLPPVISPITGPTLSLIVVVLVLEYLSVSPTPLPLPPR
jgi:hypothetical protein